MSEQKPPNRTSTWSMGFVFPFFALFALHSAGAFITLSSAADTEAEERRIFFFFALGVGGVTASRPHPSLSISVTVKITALDPWLRGGHVT